MGTMIFGSRRGFGTNFLVHGALVFADGQAVTVVADPDFAGARAHPAQLRRVHEARLRDVATAHTRRIHRDR